MVSQYTAPTYRKTADAVKADNPKAKGVIKFLYKAWISMFALVLYSIDGIGIGTEFQIRTHEELELGGRAEEPRVSMSMISVPSIPGHLQSVTPARCAKTP